MKRIPVILDGDPGHDDAIAWVLANASPMLDIKAVTSCCGNQTMEKTTYNALRICTLIGLNVPVAKGRVKPFLKPPMVAPNVHGQSGLDGPKLPEPAFDVVPEDAVTLMARIIEESDEPITLVPTGPLTNIAALFMAHPELKKKISHIYLMGGGIHHGNWAPAAEFNIQVDPEAAAYVFAAGVPITMAGLDVTEKAQIYPEEFEIIRGLGSKVATTVAEWFDFFFQYHKSLNGYKGAAVHDAVAIVAMTNPEIFEVKDMYVEVETDSECCNGATIGDVHGVLGKEPNVHVLWNLDRDAFAKILIDAVRTYGEVPK